MTRDQMAEAALYAWLAPQLAVKIIVGMIAGSP